MANKTINDLTTQTSAAAGDFVPIWRASQADTVKITKSNFIGATLTGAGTIATGGFTLTVAATGTAALLNVAQSFLASQAFAPSATNARPIVVNVDAAVSVVSTEWQIASTRRMYVNQTSNVSQMAFDDADLGALIGPNLVLGRNNNGSTPAGGNIRFVDKGGTEFFLWADDSGVLRIGTTSPTNANDASGTVVGTQTSWIDLKENIEAIADPAGLLQAVLAVDLYNYQLREDGHQNADGSKPIYTGLVITHEDRENDAWFATGLAENQIPVLNQRNLFGYLIGAIQAQQDLIKDLAGRMAALGAG